MGKIGKKVTRGQTERNINDRGKEDRRRRIVQRNAEEMRGMGEE